ncbi:RrF2 family transcriptional regulator [Gimesia fumaroli]|uniref:Iron-responsive transcriptional regulator n=1 Tax=Gimesia fumaroli TaxID=2527976 RepID=A0A518IC38_9PLAN|nr:Rrf2 family transcriptional regulator [Gimesia fumaroli]QDV50668.1 iron-responsive transcriptional regulator [Gimesia fumaroli]
MISQTEEYALRAMTCLAFRHPSYITRDQLFDVTQVPHAYLPKIMLELNRTGLIRSQRGQNGGYALIQHPQNISLLKIIKAVRTGTSKNAPLYASSNSTEINQLNEHLNQTFSMLESVLDQTSLADIITTPVEQNSKEQHCVQK